jgi:hydrogenase maturation protein HypF
VLLAYTPLHHLLLEAVGRPLVMTSGNLSDEPIAHVDDDAVARLGPLVDGLLTHDRPIHVRCDDSVVRAGPGWTQVLRRSRGYAPEPLGLTTPARRHVLAVGAELKSTVSVARDGHLVTSHHIGDLEHPAAHAAFEQAVEHLCRLCSVTPELVAHDLHPEYLSTKWALDTDLPTLGVQHHHAHIASCLVEHRHDGRVLGIAFDGLGYEFVAADLVRCDRLGHLRAVALPGGAAAIREPWRMAVAWVHAVDGPEAARREGRHLDPRAAALVEVLDSGQAPLTTSVGRLFDAVAALLAVRSRVTYEGQAAIELEALARRVPRSAAPVLAPDLVLEGDLAQLDPGSAIAAVLDARERGTPTEVIAAGFHEGLGRATAELATRLAARHGLGTVALSGGVFQNARLSEVVASGLHEGGLTVLAHRRVPPNDGGISVGQAGIAARLEKAPA